MPIQVGDPAAIADFQFLWSDEIPSGVTLQSVEHTAPDGTTLMGESTDANAGTSIARISGGTHGGIYTVKALATLSNGEKIPGSFTRRVFFGATA